MPRASVGARPVAERTIQNRISGPLLDRVDLTVAVQPASAAELARAPAGEQCNGRHPRRPARGQHQRERGVPTPRRTRSVMVGPEAQNLAESAMERLRLSPRGFTRTLRVARTIADLAGAEVVRRQDVAEALAFRHRMPGRKG